MVLLISYSKLRMMQKLVGIVSSPLEVKELQLDFKKCTVGQLIGKCCSTLTNVRHYIFRSTSKSRPNNIRGGENVRPYVRPSTKSFFDFNEIWYIGRG